ncbi:MAG TPA: hypothetical protein VGJ06_14990 [Candidatus Acidoferrum sp.]|jgi:hypothetical protein
MHKGLLWISCTAAAAGLGAGVCATLSASGRALVGFGRQGSQSAQSGAAADSRITRGKKLMLKDGSFQLVRSYEKNGDRVRFFSEERGDWEEIPAAMVDWDATAKAEKSAAAADDALAAKVHKQEEAQRIDTTLDVDASLQVGGGAFLPPGEGMFAVEGKSVIPIPQVGTAVRNDRKNQLKRVLSPLPIIPGKKNIELDGKRATLRINSVNPEFYLRELTTDDEQESGLERTSRQSTTGPDVELLRATIKGNKRIIESVRSFMGEEVGRENKTIAIQQWTVARRVYRYTLSEPLPPGEYALAELLPGGLNLFVWDFGVDERGEIKK